MKIKPLWKLGAALERCGKRLKKVSGWIPVKAAKKPREPRRKKAQGVPLPFEDLEGGVE